MNPFKSRCPIENRSDWIGSEKVFGLLDSCIRQRVNTYIMGAEGSGKTSLLNCYFMFPYRKNLAVKDRVLAVWPADLSNKTGGEDICRYLSDQLKYAVKRLLRGREDYEAIMEDIESLDARSSVAELQQLITMLHDEYGYFIVLVMDHFETFTSSPLVGMEHHEMFRSLIEAGSIQCIVATNYDLSQDSLPADVRGSFYLQKFTQPITLEPLTEQEALEFIEKKQAYEGDGIKLNKEQIKALHKLSGGIPGLLEIGAERVYDALEQNGGILEGKLPVKAVYDACRPVFRSWCKLLSPVQIQVLKYLASQVEKKGELAFADFTGDAKFESAVAALKERGLLTKHKGSLDKYGNPIPAGDWEVSFYSLLFQQFCRGGAMEEAAQANPLTARTAKEPDRTVQPIVNNYYFHDKAYMQGAQDNSQTVNAENIQIVQGITPSQLLQLLENSGDSRQLFAEQLSLQLKKHFSQGAFAIPEKTAGIGEEEYAQQYDMEFDHIGGQIIQDVQVDEEDDLIGVTPEELVTLDMRFREARDRSRPFLTEEILGSQSERCQFYLKLSVVVEDALRLPGIHMDDYSPQLVLYGKALEQSLRDNLYELFHREQKLSIYSTVLHKEDSEAKDIFSNKTCGQTYIGNYAFLIAEKKQYLASLCENCCVTVEKGSLQPESGEWWGSFQTDIHSARAIRNLADHAGEDSPDEENLEKMCGLLFGSQQECGILEKAAVGKQLLKRLFPAEIPDEVIQEMTGHTCEMLCTALKTNGGMKGVTCSGSYAVNISPKKVQKYRNTLEETEFHPQGKQFTVKILEFKVQDGNQFFAAELV